MGMYSEDENAGGRPRNMSDADRRHKTLTELGNLQSLSNLLAATSPSGKKNEKFSFADEDSSGRKKHAPTNSIPKIMRQLSGQEVGHFGATGADGAGALPASSDIIDIVKSHFNEESVDGKNKKREVSHMSYVYGDEESQYEQKHQFEPKLPEIEEREASHASTTYKTESH